MMETRSADLQTCTNPIILNELFETEEENSVPLIKVLPLEMILTLSRIMSYIYGAPFLMFLDHTQRRSTVGRTPLDE